MNKTSPSPLRSTLLPPRTRDNAVGKSGKQEAKLFESGGRSFSGKEMTFLRKKGDRSNFGISKVCWVHLVTLIYQVCHFTYEDQTLTPA